MPNSLFFFFDLLTKFYFFLHLLLGTDDRRNFLTTGVKILIRLVYLTIIINVLVLSVSMVTLEFLMVDSIKFFLSEFFTFRFKTCFDTVVNSLTTLLLSASKFISLPTCFTV